MKQFIKVLGKTQDSFQYLNVVFPNFSEDEIKEGVFVCPELRHLMQDEKKGKIKSVTKEFSLNKFCFI